MRQRKRFYNHDQSSIAISMNRLTSAVASSRKEHFHQTNTHTLQHLLYGLEFPLVELSLHKWEIDTVGTLYYLAGELRARSTLTTFFTCRSRRKMRSICSGTSWAALNCNVTVMTAFCADGLVEEFTSVILMP